MKIAIIGNGEMGSAIKKILEKENDIFLYDKDESKNESKKSINECVNNANFIFLCLPSWALKEAIENIKPSISKETILISFSKGLTREEESVDQVIKKYFKNKYALMMGPMISEEISIGNKGFTVVATKDKKVFKEIKEIFKDKNISLEHSKSVRSEAIAGVLKNIYTLFLSIALNYENNNNTKGYLFTRSLREMMTIMKYLGLEKESVLSISGLGDLIASSSSSYSKNEEAGKEIAKEGISHQKSEGLVSLSPLISMLGKKYKTLPILCLLEKIIIEEKNSQTEIQNFFKEKGAK